MTAPARERLSPARTSAAVAAPVSAPEPQKVAQPSALAKSLATLPPARPAGTGQKLPADMPTAVTEIAGGTVLEPNPAVVDYLDTKQAKPIPVSVGSIAAGHLWVQKRKDGYDFKAGQSLPLMLPLCDRLRAGGVEPVLAVKSEKGIVEGYASVAGKSGKPGDTDDLFAAIKKNAAVLGWAGLTDIRLPKSQNELHGSRLILKASQVSFSLAGFLHATGSFGFENEKMTFDATATGSVKGLADIALPISLAPDGTLAGRIEVATKLAGFTGNVVAAFGGGLVDVRGTVGYRNEKFDGQITIIATDPKSAEALVAGQIPGQPAAPSAAPPVGGAQGGPAPAAVNPLVPAPGKRVVAGWGNINVTLADWLSGSALVVVDPVGYVTIVGKITPRMNRPLFEQKNFIYPFPPFPEFRASYGIPYVADIFVSAQLGLSAEARIGPATLTDMEMTGTWSTDPKTLQSFGLTGTLNVSGFAGLRLTAVGKAGLTIVRHEVAFGVAVDALAGIKGYVEAKPTIGYRELQDPLAGKRGEFFIGGHMELAARPFLGLSGTMFVKLDSPWWSPAPDKTWPWPIGELEYPLPGEFGIGADVEHVLGSGKVPEVKFSEVSFDASKFLTDLVDEEVPTKSSTDEQKKGGWKEAIPATAAPAPPPAPPAPTKPPAPKAKPAEPGPRAKQKPNVPKPDKAENWAKGLESLGQLAERSNTDPLDQNDIDAAIKSIRRKFGFTRLAAEPAGDVWVVSAEMNPKAERTIKRDPSKKSDEIDPRKLRMRIEALGSPILLDRLESIDLKSPSSSHQLKDLERDVSIAETGPKPGREVEPGLSESKTPGKSETGKDPKAVGKFAHDPMKEPLGEELSPRTIPPEFARLVAEKKIIKFHEMPTGLRHEQWLGVDSRADRVGAVIYEIKPNNSEQIKKGLEQIDRYVRLANNTEYEGRLGYLGRRDWTGVVVVYSMWKAKKYVP